MKADSGGKGRSLWLQNGGVCLKKRYIAFLIFLLTTSLFLTISSSLGQDIYISQNNTTVPNLMYIWSITGIENDQVIMALNQEGNDLFGQAKYEPENADSWNGEVAGLVSGNQVYLVITALKGTEQVSTLLEGTFAADSISGKFLQTDGVNISNPGEFNAMWINPELSTYTPAKVKDLTPEIAISNITAVSDANQQKAETKYHDVRQDADRILTGVGDISQIPIGMGGSGLP